MDNNSMTDEQKNQKQRMAAVEKARKLGLNESMIKFGVHLRDNLGAMNQAGVHESNHELWTKLLSIFGDAWAVYEEITGGFTIDDAMRVFVAEILDNVKL